MKKTNISKSSFMRGRQCHKALWLHKHRPELAPHEPVSRDARKDEGTAVGKLACGLFPGGYEVPADDWGNTDFNELLDLTEKYIKAGDAPIYEATISAADVSVMVDILAPTEKGWEIYEVKGSTSVKSHQCHDAAIQYYALKKAGLEIAGVFKDYYTPSMKGRYSIKYVLPALVPSMKYDGEVADGGAAMDAFARMRETATQPSARNFAVICWTTANWTRWRWSEYWRRCARRRLQIRASLCKKSGYYFSAVFSSAKNDMHFLIPGLGTNAGTT